MAIEIPVATYRLQMNAGFTLENALDLVDYFADVGVSHLYLSPVLAARPKSTHGYDVIDPERVNPELGTEGDFNELVDAIAQRGLSVLLDIVPNHMAADPHNGWWRDVLENGPASEYARCFDVTWEPEHSTISRRVLLPVLGKHYSEALESGELKLVLQNSALTVQYFDRVLPLSVQSYAPVLREALNAHERRLGLDADGRWELASLLDVLRAMTALQQGAELQQIRVEARRAFRKLLENAAARESIEQAIASYNGQPGNAASFDKLHALLEQQYYQLAFWKAASEEINYRRFFDISDLIGLRVEDPAVFDLSHRLILRWIADGKVAGLRIDHVDGLRDPTGYLQQLRSRTNAYTVVEKILTGDERLPAEWPVEGTTGYEFAAVLNGLFVHPDGLTRLDALYAERTGFATPFEDLVYEKKRYVLDTLFVGELRALERQLSAIARKDRYACDVPAAALGEALTVVTACLPVYRTYTRGGIVASRDAGLIEQAVRNALQQAPATDTAALAFVRRVLLMERPGGHEQEWLDFVMRWQQLTGPAMAKGFEDTTLYVYNRLLSNNEVGADPSRAIVTPADFGRRMRIIQQKWPGTLNATTTHDTKRSEDVRARLNVLSELADEWAERIERWSELNEEHRQTVRRTRAPDANEALMIYQTIVGAWPLEPGDHATFPDRIKQFVIKAVRESKTHSSWLRPDEAYEEALVAYVDALLKPGSDFHTDISAFAERVAYFGAWNALSQLTVKLAAPGVPDFYQGSELWTLSLVDPDNRRAVDYEHRREMLARIRSADAAELLRDWRSGAVKMLMTTRGLAAREEHREIFAMGEFVPLRVDGTHANHVIAFARTLGEQSVVAIAPRLPVSLIAPGSAYDPGIWADTTVEMPKALEPAGNCFTGGGVFGGGVIPLREVLVDFPFAIIA